MQNRIFLNKDQVYEFVADSIYAPQENLKFASRCYDGRHLNEPSLPALALPGGDAGELALLYAAATSYSFEIDYDKAFSVLSDLVGGVEQLSYHTDVDGECEHIADMKKDLEAYSLKPEQMDTLEKQLQVIKKKQKNQIVLKGDHREGAVLIVKGEYGIYPQGEVRTELASAQVQVFVYHQGLAESRRKVFTKELIENKAVTLFDGLDEEYLYQVLTDVSDTHLFETSKRIAHGLPLYSVDIESPAKIKIKELDVLT